MLKLSSLIDKAIYDYNMLEENDRILIGASGGKDSTALIEYFSSRTKRRDCNFSYLALHIQNDFSPPLPESILNLFNEWQVPFKSIDVDVLGRLKEGRKMNCWWCSLQRRGELNRFAIENGFNKIALGHHLDDVLETLLMNMLEKAELATMPPRLKYNKYPVTIIRPLYYASVETIIEHAKQMGYYGYTCTCDYQNNSGRKNARSLLEKLSEGNRSKKEKMLLSLKNIKTEYLP
ncbi:MAG: tRNA 2-thiocytidine biosynthesis protein TtcA [Treponema sp.]|nr:tRNA 2-thiocytidine biosynthesis protein TtcA [Treponema sp.]